jgi:hypothetical protein
MFEFVHIRVCEHLCERVQVLVPKQKSTCECVHIRLHEHVRVGVKVLVPYKDIWVPGQVQVQNYVSIVTDTLWQKIQTIINGNRSKQEENY